MKAGGIARLSIGLASNEHVWKILKAIYMLYLTCHCVVYKRQVTSYLEYIKLELILSFLFGQEISESNAHK